MKIIYHPIAAIPNTAESTPVSVSGDTITIDNVDYDLAPLPEGATISIGEPFARPIRRDSGTIVVEVLYFYDDTKVDMTNMVSDTGLVYEITEGTTPKPLRYKLMEVLNEPSAES